MSDNQIPLPPHEFERGTTYPEECRLCGLEFDRHPHAFVWKAPFIIVQSGRTDDHRKACMVCRVCGNLESDELHGNPDSGFDIPDDE